MTFDEILELGIQKVRNRRKHLQFEIMCLENKVTETYEQEKYWEEAQREKESSND